MVEHQKPSEEDSLRPEIKIKDGKKSIKKFRKELETGTFKKGTKVDVLVLDEQAGKRWLCAHETSRYCNFPIKWI